MRNGCATSAAASRNQSGSSSPSSSPPPPPLVSASSLSGVSIGGSDSVESRLSEMSTGVDADFAASIASAASNSAMPSLSVNQKVSSTASTMPAGQSYASNSPESAVATIGARPAPAAETRTILVAHMTSIVTATKSPSAFALLPATTTSPAPDTIISGELGKRQPQWPSGPVPSSIMSHDGMAPELSIDGCSSRRSVYLSAISSGVPWREP